jgi:putative addiction module killer protein
VFEIRTTGVFSKWIGTLPDRRARSLIFNRIDHAAVGDLGDARPVGGGVFGFRIHHGPGYRVYFRHDGLTIIILLCGGDKSTQRRDIGKAMRLAQEA